MIGVHCNIFSFGVDTLSLRPNQGVPHHTAGAQHILYVHTFYDPFYGSFTKEIFASYSSSPSNSMDVDVVAIPHQTYNAILGGANSQTTHKDPMDITKANERE